MLRPGRDGQHGEDGQVDSLRLVGQAEGPFLLPCHQSPGYEEDRQGNILRHRQCAGAATYRSNIGIADRFKPITHILPADHQMCYSSPAELVAGYEGITLEEAKKVLEQFPPEFLLQRELASSQARVYGAKKTS